MAERQSGILLHPTSLPGGYGIGELGREALRFVDLVHRRYISADQEHEGSVVEFLDSDDVAIRFRPEAALTWDERGSAASDALRASGGALPLLPTEPRP